MRFHCIVTNYYALTSIVTNSNVRMYLTILAEKHISNSKKNPPDITSESLYYTVLHQKVLIIIEKYVHI